MNFCSNCGSSNLVFDIPEGDTRPRTICPDCGKIHYSNPRIIAGCLPLWEGRVLLCKRAIKPRFGFWNVPGGFLENGETAEAGAAREVREEALAKVGIMELHAIFSLPDFNQVYIHFLAELKNGEFGVGEESADTRLLLESEIPWSEMAFQSSIFSLRHYFEDREKGIRKVHIGSF